MSFGGRKVAPNGRKVVSNGKQFFVEMSPNLVPNPWFSPMLAQLDFCKVNRVFTYVKYNKNIELPRRTAKIHILNTASTFYDVYYVFGSEFDPFLHFSPRLKVMHAFKAEFVAFRERKQEKVESCHLEAGKLRPTAEKLCQTENSFLLKCLRT